MKVLIVRAVTIYVQHYESTSPPVTGQCRRQLEGRWQRYLVQELPCFFVSNFRFSTYCSRPSRATESEDQPCSPLLAPSVLSALHDPLKAYGQLRVHCPETLEMCRKASVGPSLSHCDLSAASYVGAWRRRKQVSSKYRGMEREAFRHACNVSESDAHGKAQATVDKRQATSAGESGKSSQSKPSSTDKLLLKQDVAR